MHLAMSVQVYSSFDAIPEPLLNFLDAAGRRDFFCGIPWFRALLRLTGPAEDRVRIYAAERGGRTIAALIARERRAAGRLRTHMLLGPSQGSNAAAYGPLLDGDCAAAGLREIGKTIARERIEVLRFDGLDRSSADFAALLAAFRGAGLLVQRFFNFYSRFETVRGVTIEQYLARRAPPMRDLLGRHLRRPAPPEGMRFELLTGGDGLARSLIDYALIDLQSGAVLEPYPEFTLELARVAAECGVLRLGLLYVDDEPAAAQLWLVSGGRATLWRPRHAERFAEREVDIVLLAEMLRQLLQRDTVGEIEFARDVGDYGGEWLDGLRERVGLVVFNPRTVRGLLAAARHIGGHVAMAVARRVKRLLRPVVRLR